MEIPRAVVLGFILFVVIADYLPEICLKMEQLSLMLRFSSYIAALSGLSKMGHLCTSIFPDRQFGWTFEGLQTWAMFLGVNYTAIEFWRFCVGCVYAGLRRYCLKQYSNVCADISVIMSIAGLVLSLIISALIRCIKPMSSSPTDLGETGAAQVQQKRGRSRPPKVRS